MEKEKDGQFHVFDISLIRNGSQVETTVYRKPSASDRYLHFTCAQAWRKNTTAIHTLHSNLISAVFLHEVVSPDKGHRAEISMKLHHKIS